ncbi:hypothetical protein R1sor_016424 [Riccia sorocarpa]|uniref:Uncharacterized protein n=1 Tax=Riccia sorocarpa TaxID=122646 RepID=A0ABD3HIG7_9MARC
MKVKLFRSRRLKRILFLECGKDFADELLGLLVMPLGTMMRRLKNSFEKNGTALYNLYASMKNIEDTAFSTSDAKRVLIDPAFHYTVESSLCNRDLKIALKRSHTGVVFFLLCD